MFREDTVHPENYDASMEQTLKAVIDDFSRILFIFLNRISAYAGYGEGFR